MRYRVIIIVVSFSCKPFASNILFVLFISGEPFVNLAMENAVPLPSVDNCDEIADTLRQNNSELSKLINWTQEDKQKAAEEKRKEKNAKKKRKQPEATDNQPDTNTSDAAQKKQKTAKIHDGSLYRRKCKAYWNVMAPKLISAEFTRPDFNKLSEQQAQALVTSYQQHFSGFGIFAVAPQALHLLAKGVEYASIQADNAFGVGNIRYYADDVSADDDVTTLLYELIIDETSMEPLTPRKRLLLKLAEKATARYSINKNTKTYMATLSKSVPASLVDEFADI